MNVPLVQIVRAASLALRIISSALHNVQTHARVVIMGMRIQTCAHFVIHPALPVQDQLLTTVSPALEDCSFQEAVVSWHALMSPTKVVPSAFHAPSLFHFVPHPPTSSVASLGTSLMEIHALRYAQVEPTEMKTLTPAKVAIHSAKLVAILLIPIAGHAVQMP